MSLRRSILIWSRTLLIGLMALLPLMPVHAQSGPVAGEPTRSQALKALQDPIAGVSSALVVDALVPLSARFPGFFGTTGRSDFPPALLGASFPSRFRTVLADGAGRDLPGS